ncbi:hypothetical protein Deba_3284 [Desulfarculus baarsii DSM 2075]|uniref:Phage gp6-like head-tail connector protein n=1 Tax=Desulfarculus baarsii (strain ATCC 33931 / DSM 2075 / LMG 7858 / VKM B-1802 / 2st14) TaxID=644282 RepID=E1QM52_DESB2|nr:head-tail connector protein [Desulfarculus baarsii]ADK86637.1 hypothetical protein Deba_3284 [Desulfarculus baarsii DSM 2075]
MALSGDALTGLEAVKAYLAKTSDDDDTLLEGLIEAVSAQFNSFTGRKLRARDYHYDPTSPAHDPAAAVLAGSGYAELILPQYPVVGISELWLDNALLAPSAYAVDAAAGVLRRLSGVFGRGVANVRLAYRAGLEVVPADLSQAAVEQTVVRYQQSYAGQGRLGLLARTLADGSVSYRDGELLPQARAVLERYKSRGLL